VKINIYLYSKIINEGEKMKKVTLAIIFLTAFCFLLAIGLPCQATDNALYVCKNNKTGTPRLVNSPSKCNAKTEHLVTLTPATDHYQELAFSINPGESYSFALPDVQAPVRIEVSFSSFNGGTQTPSEIMYAVMNQDQQSGQMTWIGTSSDGNQLGSNSLDDTQIASIGGGNAVLEVDSLANHTVKISQNANRTTLPGHYIVHLWY
jgi:hypothetical protein